MSSVKETSEVPKTVTKTGSIDGKEFCFYVQKFADGREFVGCYVVDTRDNYRYTVFPSEELRQRWLVWKDYLDSDE